jgi:glucosamine-6-phosphate deaminase
MLSVVVMNGGVSLPGFGACVSRFYELPGMTGWMRDPPEPWIGGCGVLSSVDESLVSMEVSFGMAQEPTLVVVKNADEMSAMAAEIVAEVLTIRPTAPISLPTGSTPVGMFENLIAASRSGTLDLTRFHLFCLDEYLGVTPDNPNTLTAWLERTLIEPAGIPLKNVHMLPVDAADPNAAANSYDQSIRDVGNLALAVLGIGNNGHIAYNEPGSDADSRTRVVNLTQESIDQAAGYFDGASVPTKAMTVGVGTLLESDRIVLIAHGAGKTEIIRRALREPMSSDVPASWLRLVPEQVTIILDEAAAAAL